MVPKDKSYRFRLPQELFAVAEPRPSDEDLTLAQVLRRLLSAWVAGEIELPPYRDIGVRARGLRHKANGPRGAGNTHATLAAPPS